MVALKTCRTAQAVVTLQAYAVDQELADDVMVRQVRVAVRKMVTLKVTPLDSAVDLSVENHQACEVGLVQNSPAVDSAPGEL